MARHAHALSTGRLMRGVAIMCAVMSAADCGGTKDAEPAADLVIVNARVWTVDPGRPEAQAVAVRGDRIAAVGTTGEVQRLRGEGTRVIDAGGRFLMPGFHDAHIHLMNGGHQLDAVDLKDAPTPEEFARRIGERAKATPKGEWVLGGNWDEQGWPGAPLPTRQMIDAVTPDTPVFVHRYDGHMALANTAALRIAGVTRRTPEVPGGLIVRDAQGEPTGILKDAAMGYVSVPDETPEQRLRILKHALEHMASLGVTSVQDMGPDPDDVRLYVELAGRGELTTRIRAVRAEVPLARELADGVKPQAAKASPFLRMSGAKGFADGSLGSTTAFFFEPYTDDPGSRGLLADEMQPLEAMRDRLIALDRAGQQLCIHAIGDRAISMVLDLFGDVEKANGRRDRRPRIEHSQHPAPSDFARYAAAGAIASVQPYHAIDDGKWAERRIGPERVKTTYAFKSFLDAGVRLAIGTDWPVAPLDPRLNLYAAVTRATLDGKNPGGWVPGQKLTVAQVIEGYTMGAAYSAFEEGEKGSIAAGKLADLVLLDRDPFAVAPEAIRDLQVDVTVAGGRVTFERPAR